MHLFNPSLKFRVTNQIQKKNEFLPTYLQVFVGVTFYKLKFLEIILLSRISEISLDGKRLRWLFICRGAGSNLQFSTSHTHYSLSGPVFHLTPPSPPWEDFLPNASFLCWHLRCATLRPCTHDLLPLLDFNVVTWIMIAYHALSTLDISSLLLFSLSILPSLYSPGHGPSLPWQCQPLSPHPDEKELRN